MVPQSDGHERVRGSTVTLRIALMWFEVCVCGQCPGPLQSKEHGTDRNVCKTYTSCYGVGLLTLRLMTLWQDKKRAGTNQMCVREWERNQYPIRLLRKSKRTESSKPSCSDHLMCACQRAAKRERRTLSRLRHLRLMFGKSIARLLYTRWSRCSLSWHACNLQTFLDGASLPCTAWSSGS